MHLRQFRLPPYLIEILKVLRINIIQTSFIFIYALGHQAESLARHYSSKGVCGCLNLGLRPNRNA